MTRTTEQTHGELLVALSNAIVGVYKELYGKGPVRARTWYLDDMVICVLGDALTRSEQTLVEIGRGDRVALQRESFHEAARPVFMHVVEELTGRRVNAVLNATDEDQDVSTLVFLLESAETAALNDTHEGLRRMGEQNRRRGRTVVAWGPLRADGVRAGARAVEHT